jgi:quinol monooxygenase YgiN
MQVRANEPGTLSYELCIGDTEPLKALVYERWAGAALSLRAAL